MIHSISTVSQSSVTGPGPGFTKGLKQKNVITLREKS